MKMMLRLALFTCLLALSGMASAATYYVRTDGGTAAQCTGLGDAAYPGTGTAQPCAWNHLSWALGRALNGGPPARITGGDTVIVGNGSYKMGYSTAGDAGDQTSCDSSYAYDCVLGKVPSGTVGNPTRILGRDYATGCKVRPELWGTQRNSYVLNLVDANNVEVQCLEITDRSNCIEGHYLPAYQCVRNTFPHGDWAGTGIRSTNSSNVLLKDLHIHGLAHSGVHAGGLTNWTVENVRIAANGFVGWDGDVGAGSSNSGDLIFRNLEIAWNGCTEDYPSTRIVACWGQGSNGYGDGMGTGASLGNWLIEDSSFHHNTSDGMDLLYLDPSATLTLRRVRAFGNGGNQLKTSGTLDMENIYVVGNCEYFFEKFGTAMGFGDSCRAAGNVLSIALPNLPGKRVSMRYMTVTGTGDCLVLFGGAPLGTATSVEIQNSVFEGQIDWYADRTGSPGERACFIYVDGTAPVINLANNVVYGTKLGGDYTCPPDTGTICTNPLVRNNDKDRYDGRPTAASPMRNGADISKPFPPGDIMGRTRPQESTPTIGAFEYIP